MLRRLARFGFVIVIGALATALGLAIAVTQTAAGRARLGRVLAEQSRLLVRGSIEVARVGGTIFSSLELDSVTIRDTSGTLLVLVPRLEADYRLRSLLTRRIVFDRVRLAGPRINLVHHRGGRLNFEEVFRLGEGPPSRARPPLIEFRNVEVEDGIVSIRTPWSPPGQLRTGTQQDSALRAQRLTPGKRIEEGNAREGLQQVRTIQGLHLRLSRLRAQTPEREPLLIALDSLALELNDPLVILTDARGQLRQARDTLWFNLERVAMPRTRGTAEGLVAWPQDTVLFDFEFDAEAAALADLRFVSPEFPDLEGRARLVAFSHSGLETDYEVRDLDLSDATSRVRGNLVAMTHKFRGLGFRGLDLALENLDLEVARPYLDTLPFQGRVSGRLRADGYFDAMRVDLDWHFFDDRVPGQPDNHLAMAGDIALGGDEGVVFRETAVSAADLDLATVRLATPAVILEGRAWGRGTLEGPWKEVTFTGEMVHHDGDRPPSLAEGRVQLNTRSEMVAVDANLDLAPLDFEGIRRAFPTLTTEGDLTGSVQLRGPLDRLAVTADLRGALGRIRAEGTIAAVPPHWGADSLWLGFEGLDLAVARGEGPSTSLDGEAVLRGTVDSAVAPEGELRLALGPGLIRELSIDSAVARLAVRDSVIVVDTAALHWSKGLVTATGRLGWSAPKTGTLAIEGRAADLGVFDSLLAKVAGVVPDSLTTREPLSGAASASLTLRGALDSLDLSASGETSGLRWDPLRVTRVRMRVDRRAGVRPRLALSLAADSLVAGPRRYTGLAFEAEGPADSLGWDARATGGLASLRAAGAWRSNGERVLDLRSVDLALGHHHWLLEQPVSVAIGDSVRLLAPLRLGTDDGGSRIEAEGVVPHQAPGELSLRVFGLDLQDVYAALQRDTAQARGTVAVDFRIGGTAEAPTVRGTGTLTGAVFGDFRAPLVRSAFNYAGQRLDANLEFWRTGRAVAEMNAALPITLAWSNVRGRRTLAGPLAIRLRADSLDLAISEAFTRNLRQMRGILAADVAVSGTWSVPRLGGTVRLAGGAATVPALGISYAGVDGDIGLSGDSILVHRLRVGSGDGELGVTGVVRLEELTHPVLDLELEGRNFRVINVPDFLALEADGKVRLQGPVTHPVLTGSATARNTVLYFSDLVTKTLVDLEDPLYADLVDTAAIRQRGLGAQFQSRFLDSLSIRDLRFQAAERVWLRSSEANIQLEGSVAVNKVRKDYRLEGVFNAVRGTYTLRLIASRAFTVQRGTVRYLGTPDLDAALDVEAEHTIQAANVEEKELKVIARITGTLLTPQLSLESTIRPPLSQSDIVSLLILGRPLNTQVASSQQQQVVDQGLALAASVVASELERSLASDQGAAPTAIAIRPGVAYAGVASGSSLSRLSAGWQLGEKWFVSLNAGFCPGFESFDYRNFGAGIEYRFSGRVRFEASAEPVQTCVAGSASGQTSKRYQFGSDIRWIKEF